MTFTTECGPDQLTQSMNPSTDAKSILFLVNIVGIGGAEMQVRTLALGMARRGWDVTLVTLLPSFNLVEGLSENGVRLECLNMRRGVPDPGAIFRLRRILLARSPHIVHSHIVHANILARIVRLFTRIPVLITSAHSMIEGSRKLELAYRYTDRLADLTTNVSQSAVDRYVQRGVVPAARIRFVPNGIDLQQFRPNDSDRQQLRRDLDVGDRFVWLGVGRLGPEKNYPNMIEAFAQLADPNAMLFIVGSGELEADLRQRVAERGLQQSVRFLGLRTDVPKLMNCADGYVMSSDWEGMPLVLQEAAATELPIVATDVGGNREVIRDGRGGVLVPAKDSTALCQAMRRVMNMTPQERRNMGQAAGEYVTAQFDLENVLDNWEAIYRELLAARMPAAVTA